MKGAYFRIEYSHPVVATNRTSHDRRMKILNNRFLLCLLAVLAQPAGVSASSWTCQQADITRQVVIFYPEAPVQLPCKVFYAKPNENVMPRVLWEAQNTPNYCEIKAVKFIEKLVSMGWQCYLDGLPENGKFSIYYDAFGIMPE